MNTNEEKNNFEKRWNEWVCVLFKFIMTLIVICRVCALMCELFK